MLLPTAPPYFLDEDNTLLWYDGRGRPKKFIPSRWDAEQGCFLHVTNFNTKILEGEALNAHLDLIETMRIKNCKLA